jgi:hypothetical protein
MDNSIMTHAAFFSAIEKCRVKPKAKGITQIRACAIAYCRPHHWALRGVKIDLMRERNFLK